MFAKKPAISFEKGVLHRRETNIRGDRIYSVKIGQRERGYGIYLNPDREGNRRALVRSSNPLFKGRLRICTFNQFELNGNCLNIPQVSSTYFPEEAENQIPRSLLRKLRNAPRRL